MSKNLRGVGSGVAIDDGNRRGTKRRRIVILTSALALVGFAMGPPAAMTAVARTMLSDPCLGVPDGTVCDDGNACTLTDTCQADVCAGGNPVVCTASDPCHDAGACDTVSGACSNPAAANGAPCSDGHACTLGDTCQYGVCTAGTPVGCGIEEIYASNYPDNKITVFVRTANGDVSPIRTIRTGLSSPVVLGIDLLHQELFVPNNRAFDQEPAVNVYDLTAFAGNDVPKRTITGPLAGLNRPAGLVVDSVHQELYVSNDLNDATSAILVFPLSADGNVAPTRILGGFLTGINGPVGLAVDVVHDELLILNYKTNAGGSITVFPRTASGDVAPLRTIQGALTGFNNPAGLALDLAHDELIVANSYFGTSSPGSVLVFHRLDSGDTSPLRQISGPGTALCNPIGVALDLVNDEIVIGNSNASTNPCAQSLTTYARAASGNAAPLRQIGPGPLSALATVESVAVRTRTNCADPAMADGTPCDDGDACTQTDTCRAGVCVGSNPVSCAASDQCHVGVCDTATGACSSPPRSDGSACTDGNACTQSDTCQLGVCTSGTPVTCTASDQCHGVGVCAPATGICTNPAKANGTSCSDGNACTQTDTCQTGVCAGANPVVCTASDQCHDVGVCAPATGVCGNPAKANGASCSDGNACTQTDTCQTGVCAGANPVVCTASDQCHDVGVCAPATGVCGNPAKANGTSCSDGTACTSGDTCGGGTCQPGAALICNDANGCTTDSCSPATGCVFINNTTACNDGNACTTGDVCGGGTCHAGAAVVCDDNNPCTDDSCSPATGCVHTNNTGSCDDGNGCTTSDHCNGQGLCVGGSGLSCDDGNSCTTDSCTLAQGCTHVNNTIACDDGNACTTGDTCGGGSCLPGAGTLNCSDNNVCTTDTCNPVAGCLHVDNTSACDDGNACTAGDSCSGGSCGGAAIVCNDTNGCTTDTCNPATGCVFANNTSACNDGNACTQTDTCHGGVCTGGNPVACAPADQCHEAGVCNPSSGVCSSAAKATASACEDGNACTTGDACDGTGTCIGGAALDCNDNNTCTADLCDPSAGCVQGTSNLDASGWSADRVDGRDMVVLADAWNSCPGDPLYSAAANLDRVATMPGACVDLTDFHLFMNAFGQSCP